ncbi:MAG: hypothetical protein P4L35_00100, partial [Ignavibacteriaceae bacterium]|nr:hypothetical protein [Ignavibacteriaceae bacterium]
MNLKYHLFLIISLLFLIAACKPQNNKSGGVVNNSEFSADDYMQSFRDRFNKNDSSFIIKYSDIQ